MTLYYYAQARSYDPRAGRFTGEDIVREQLVYPDSINHYLYCYNMPMVLADRNGKNPGIVFAPLLANPVVLGLVVAIVVVVLINLIIPHKPVSIPRIEIFPDSRKEDNNVIIETPPARENPTIIEGPTAHPKEGPSITDIPNGKVEEEGSHIIEGPTATPQTGPRIITSEGTEYENGTNHGGNTKHGEQRLAERGFSEEKKEDIKNNYSRKVYQEGGRVVYAKKNGNYYDVIIENEDGETITAVGGNTKSLRTWRDVERMLNNNGGYSTLPY